MIVITLITLQMPIVLVARCFSISEMDSIHKRQYFLHYVMLIFGKSSIFCELTLLLCQRFSPKFLMSALMLCHHYLLNTISMIPSYSSRLFLDQMGGLELQPDGSRRRKWSWLDTETHTHAPPVQPLCFALNKYIGIRVLSQDHISMTFLHYNRSCRFNVGVKLRV